MTKRSIDAMGDFVGDRLFDAHRIAEHKGDERTMARNQFARWVLHQWISLRAEADAMRSRHNHGGTSEAYIIAAAQIDAMAAMYEPAVRLLAAAWDGHPDYRPEWAPQ